jgi:hypothetical protein
MAFAHKLQIRFPPPEMHHSSRSRLELAPAGVGQLLTPCRQGLDAFKLPEVQSGGYVVGASSKRG